jgi:hypothetical protein
MTTSFTRPVDGESAARGRELVRYKHLRRPMLNFLREFERCGSTTEASEACGLSRQAHYGWLRRFPWYRDIFEAVRQRVERNWANRLEECLLDRALHGTPEIEYDREGNVVRTKRKPANQLLVHMLQVLRPERHGRPGGAKTEVTIDAREQGDRQEELRAKIECLTTEQLRQIDQAGKLLGY